MPNTSPSCITSERLQSKRALIDQQLQEIGIPLNYKLYFGADAAHLDEVHKVKNDVCGLKIYMGSTTGDLLMAEDRDIEEAIRVGAQAGLIVSVHAEEEDIIAARHKQLFQEGGSPSLHSKIRCPEAAKVAAEKAIHFAHKHGARLYILHLSTADELDLVRAARARGQSVYCEVTPHHLFLDESAYNDLGTFAQMNPPLRTRKDRDALWEGVADGTVDSVGTDHAPHVIEEKQQPFGKAPSGVPGMETLLPLLMHAHHEGRLSLRRLEELTRWRVQELFRLTSNQDYVLVDPDRCLEVDPSFLQSRCGWSPFTGWKLRGWPVATILNGQVYLHPTVSSIEELTCPATL
jgi:dihydroorotase